MEGPAGQARWKALPREASMEVLRGKASMVGLAVNALMAGASMEGLDGRLRRKSPMETPTENFDGRLRRNASLETR